MTVTAEVRVALKPKMTCLEAKGQAYLNHDPSYTAAFVRELLDAQQKESPTVAIKRADGSKVDVPWSTPVHDAFDLADDAKYATVQIDVPSVEKPAAATVDTPAGDVAAGDGEGKPESEKTVEERKQALAEALKAMTAGEDVGTEAARKIIDDTRRKLTDALAGADTPTKVAILEERTRALGEAIYYAGNPEYRPDPVVPAGMRAGLSIDEEARLRDWVEANAMADVGGRAGDVGGQRLFAALKGTSTLGALGEKEKYVLAHLGAEEWIKASARGEEGAEENIREITAATLKDPEEYDYVLDAFVHNVWAQRGEMTSFKGRDTTEEMLRASIDLDATKIMERFHGPNGALVFAQTLRGDKVRDLPGVDDRDRFAFVDRMHHPDGTEAIPAFRIERQEKILDEVAFGAMPPAEANAFVSYMFADMTSDDAKRLKTRQALGRALGLTLSDGAGLERGTEEALRMQDELEAAMGAKGARELLFSEGVPPPLRNAMLANLVTRPGETEPRLKPGDIAQGWESDKVGEVQLAEQERLLEGRTDPVNLKGNMLANTVGQALNMRPDKLVGPDGKPILGESFDVAAYDKEKYPFKRVIDQVEKEEHRWPDGSVRMSVVPVTVASNDWGAAAFNVIRIDDPDGTVSFVDVLGREYDNGIEVESVKVWKDTNELPPGKATFKLNLNLESKKYDSKMTPADHWTETLLTVLDFGVMIIGTAAGVAAIVTTGGLAAPAVAGAAAVYGTARAGADIYEDSQREVDVFNMEDPDARGKWFDLGTNALSVGSIGGGMRAVQLANRGAKMSRAGATIAAGFQFTANVADGAAAINSIVTLQQKWDGMSEEERSAGILQLGFQLGMGAASAKAGGGKLGDGLNPKRIRNQLEFGTPFDVTPNSKLKPGEVAVAYDPPNSATNPSDYPSKFRIEYGGDKPPSREMIEIHSRVGVAMEQAGSMKKRFDDWIKGVPAEQKRLTAGWEASHELDKISDEAARIQKRLASGDLGEEEVARLNSRLDELTDDIRVQQKRMEDWDADPTGMVKAPSGGETQRLAQDPPWPEAPKGHHWVAQPDGKPYLRRHMEADGDAPIAKLYYDEGTKSFKLVADRPAPEMTRVGAEGVENDVRWKLDKDGRLTEASGTLREYYQHAPRSKEELAAQDEVRGRGKDDDHAGHAVGHRFVLDQGVKNMFPQDSNLNVSAYKTMENEFADWISMGGEVNFKIKPAGYDADGRPKFIDVSYDVVDPATGKTVYKKQISFDNKPGQTYNRVTPETMVRGFEGEKIY